MQEKVWPERTEPAPTLAHTPSPPPMTTGVPTASPVASAASRVTPPATQVEGTISGSLSGSMPEMSTIFSDQESVFRSTQALEDASEGSVQNLPVSLSTM